ncbi:hypothetical protein ACFFX0_04590 [Citricoccus parietis]|uniref:Uncharacterized protein n=1 Tax=Citricoccus parietis TaxID=592307 RepID=A0ABV5FUY7_9MICC
MARVPLAPEAPAAVPPMTDRKTPAEPAVSACASGPASWAGWWVGSGGRTRESTKAGTTRAPSRSTTCQSAPERARIEAAVSSAPTQATEPESTSMAVAYGSAVEWRVPLTKSVLIPPDYPLPSRPRRRDGRDP